MKSDMLSDLQSGMQSDSQNQKIIHSSINFIKEVDSKYKIKFAYLFGSSARDEATKNSDIDIAIYFEQKLTDFEDAFSK